MSSMGYGDAPVAISNADYMYSFATQIIGTSIASAIFSQFAQLINKQEAGAARYQEQVQKIHEFNRLYQLPAEMRRHLLDYNELIFSAYNGFDLKAVAEIFPKQVQSRIFFELHKDLIMKVPMFRDLDHHFLSQIIVQLGTQVVLKDDFAFKKGDLGELMYFLQHGTIDIGSDDMSVVYITKEAGSYFGEIAVFSNERRTASARARTDSIMYTLSKSSFEHVAIRYPEAYHLVHARAMKLLKMVKTTNAAKETDVARARHPCSEKDDSGDDSFTFKANKDMD